MGGRAATGDSWGAVMNLRRGFFRLWLVASMLFALGTGAIFFETVRKEFERRAAQDWPGTPMIPAFCKEMRGQDGVDYDSTLKLEDGREDLCWYTLPKFRKNYPEYDDLSTTELSYRTYTRAGLPHDAPPAPWNLIAFAASLAFGIPLAALVLGSAFGWAFAGFKSKAHN
jgi:hypothetical protein